MKKFALAFAVLASFTVTAIPMTCACTKGSITVSVEGGRMDMSFSDGGRVSCDIPR